MMNTLKSKSILLAGMLTLGGVTALADPSVAGSETIASSSVSQQNQTVKGVVIDKKTGEPIIGANVLVKGTTNGVITDFDGNYTLEAPVGVITMFQVTSLSPKIRLSSLMKLPILPNGKKEPAILWIHG